jgi:hypothetical protein
LTFVIVGACLSTTVMVKVQLPPGVLTVTGVVPTGKKLPEGMLYVAGPQKPVIVAGGYVTFAPHWLSAAGTVMFAGQVMLQPNCACVLLIRQVKAPANRKLSKRILFITGNFFGKKMKLRAEIRSMKIYDIKFTSK